MEAPLPNPVSNSVRDARELNPFSAQCQIATSFKQTVVLWVLTPPTPPKQNPAAVARLQRYKEIIRFNIHCFS